MNPKPKEIVSGVVLTSAALTYYTAPAGTNTVIKAAKISNSTAAAVQATTHIVKTGGSAGADTTFTPGRMVAPMEAYLCPELVGHIIESGSMLQALGNGLTLHVSGVEIV